MSLLLRVEEEGEVLTGEELLLERTTDLRMLDDVSARRPNPGFRGLSRLPLALSVH